MPGEGAGGGAGARVARDGVREVGHNDALGGERIRGPGRGTAGVEALVALPRILRTLQRRGYRSVTIPELLALNPPSDQQVQAGFQGCVDAERPSKAFTPTGSG